MAGFMQAFTPTARPPKLEGVIKTRAQAREVYAAIVADLHTINDPIELEGFLMDMGLEIKQIEIELLFLWEGDGADFIGLEQEIERARGRTGVSW